MRAANDRNDVSFELNGAKYFTKLDMDLSQAYHQLELDEKRRYITSLVLMLACIVTNV